MNRQFFFRFALALFLIMGSRASLAQEEIFVTNSSSASVTVYSRTGSGNLAPLRTLVGAATGLTTPTGLAVDVVNNELLVVNTTNSTSQSFVTVYPRTANGNVAPLRTISGPLTGMFDSRGLSLDVVNNELAVVNRANFTVNVFARTATGNVAPLRTITSVFPSTGMSNPTDVAIDVANNELVVANNGGSLTVYARTATGNAAPLRQIIGSSTGFNNGPIGVAVDIVNNELAVTNPFFGTSFSPSALVFGRTATGNVAPLRAIVGAATGLVNPNGVAVDTVNNELVMVNAGNDSVRVYARTATGNVAPLRTIVGGNTLLNNPQFVVITTGAAPIAFVNASPRKSHGGTPFDIAIDAAGSLTPGSTPLTVEPRQIGTGYQIVFLFDTAPTSAGVTTSSGAAAVAFAGNEAIVTLTGVADATRVQVGLTNVNGVGVSATATLGFLLGDVNGNRGVSSTDISSVKSKAGQSTDATNFKQDLNVNGGISSTDISVVKSRAGQSLN